jgi:hypothetical protein
LQTAANRLVDPAERRFVVGGNHEFELRDEREEVLPHEPGGDRIAAAHRLDLRLGPALTFVDLLRDDETSAAQMGEFGWVLLVFGFDERFHWRYRRVLANAQDSSQRAQEYAFAVCPSAIDEKNDVFTGEPGQAVASNAL